MDRNTSSISIQFTRWKLFRKGEGKCTMIKKWINMILNSSFIVVISTHFFLACGSEWNTRKWGNGKTRWWPYSLGKKGKKKRKIWIRIISETQDNVKLSIRRSIEWRPGKEKKMSHQARQKTEQGRRGRKLEQKVLGEITYTNKREVVDTNLKPQESAPTITKVQSILFPLSFFCFGWGMEKKRNKQNDDKARR